MLKLWKIPWNRETTYHPLKPWNQSHMKIIWTLHKTDALKGAQGRVFLEWVNDFVSNKERIYVLQWAVQLESLFWRYARENECLVSKGKQLNRNMKHQSCISEPRYVYIYRANFEVLIFKVLQNEIYLLITGTPTADSQHIWQAHLSPPFWICTDRPSRLGSLRSFASASYSQRR